MQTYANRLKSKWTWNWFSELYIICYITDYKRFNSLNSRFLGRFDTNADRLISTRIKSTQPWSRFESENNRRITLTQSVLNHWQSMTTRHHIHRSSLPVEDFNSLHSPFQGRWWMKMKIGMLMGFLVLFTGILLLLKMR